MRLAALHPFPLKAQAQLLGKRRVFQRHLAAIIQVDKELPAPRTSQSWKPADEARARREYDPASSRLHQERIQENPRARRTCRIDHRIKHARVSPPLPSSEGRRTVIGAPVNHRRVQTELSVLEASIGASEAAAPARLSQKPHRRGLFRKPKSLQTFLKALFASAVPTASTGASPPDDARLRFFQAVVRICQIICARGQLQAQPPLQGVNVSLGRSLLPLDEVGTVPKLPSLLV